MTAAPWLVAIDIDGTLIHEDESMGVAVETAVRRVAEAGHVVTLATGRSWETARPHLERLGLTPDYVVCSNGAVTLRRDPLADGGYRREYVETFDPSEVLRSIRPHLPGSAFLVEDADGRRRYTDGMTEWNMDNAIEVDFEGLLGRPVSRVVVSSPGYDVEEFLEIVERMGLHEVSYAIGWTAWLDIAPQGVNKATALERVRGLLGIARERVFAIGDGRNDIEMLQWAAKAGRGVAMGHAPEEVRAVAGEVTGTLHEDGLAQALATLPA